MRPMSRPSSGGAYPLGKSTGVCAETGREFEAGMACVAVLCESQEELENAPDGDKGEAKPAESTLGLLRVDYSRDAWDKGARPPAIFSWWHFTQPEPGENRRLFVEDDALLDLFERLGDEDEEQSSDKRRSAFRWVLGLILVRKRLLRLDGTARTDRGNAFLLRRRGTDPALPPIELLDPGVTENDAAMIAEELGEIMAE